MPSVQSALTTSPTAAPTRISASSALYAYGRIEAIAGTKAPEIHIVTIEASATAYDYAPDRGLDAATGGAKERLTGDSPRNYWTKCRI